MSREEIQGSVNYNFNGVKYFIAKYEDSYHVWEFENTEGGSLYESDEIKDCEKWINEKMNHVD